MKNQHNYRMVINQQHSIWSSGLDIRSIEWAIKSHICFCQDLLDKRGYLFVNEIYKWLGLPLTRRGQTDGWVRPEIVTHRTVIDYTVEYDNVKSSFVIDFHNVESDILYALYDNEES